MTTEEAIDALHRLVPWERDEAIDSSLRRLIAEARKVARIKGRVREVHHPKPVPVDRPWPRVCACGCIWPCPTIRALEGRP